MGTWEADDPASRPIAAPLEKCAELLGVDLAAIQPAAAEVEPYIRVDGTKVWSLMQLERRLRPEAYGRVRGGYVTRRRRPARDHRSPRVGGVGPPVDRAGLALEGSQGVTPTRRPGAVRPGSVQTWKESPARPLPVRAPAGLRPVE